MIGARLAADHAGYAKALAIRLCVAIHATDEEKADLLSVAMLALCEAAHDFDTSRGVAFTTYAHPKIQGAMKDTLKRAHGFGGRIPTAAEVPLESIPGRACNPWPSVDRALDLASMMDRLPYRERVFLFARLVCGETGTQAGGRVGVTKGEASRGERRIAKALQEVTA